jgi:hypothetical protein
LCFSFDAKSSLLASPGPCMNPYAILLKLLLVLYPHCSEYPKWVEAYIKIEVSAHVYLRLLYLLHFLLLFNSFSFCSFEPLFEGNEIFLKFLYLISKVGESISWVKYFLMVAASTSWMINRILVSSSNPTVRDLPCGGCSLLIFSRLGLLMGSY